MKKLIFYVSFLLLMTLPVLSFAGVNLKNGNFYISYTDHDFKSLKGLEITRTYNSKTSEIGLFGYGWGSEFETRLYPIGDGAVQIHENGSGGITTFISGTQDDLLLSTCINMLLKVALQEGAVANNPAAINTYKRKLRDDEGNRHYLWKKYLALGLVETPAFSNGSKWISNDRGNQQVIKTKEGFKRIYSDGSYNLFTDEGLLTAKYDKYGDAEFTLQYNVQDKLTSIEDKVGNVFEITLNTEGLITVIQSSKGTSNYQYNGTALITSKDVAGNMYWYDYDTYKKMIAIHYTDSSSLLIEYYTSNSYVKKITDRNGKVTEYVYKYFYTPEGKVDDDHYATYVIKENIYYGKLDSNFYEYEERVKPGGDRYTYRIFTRISGYETETIYSENCKNPLKISRGSSISTFVYNNLCNLVYKETNSTITKVEYDPVINKIIRTVNIEKENEDSTVNLFIYNKNGDLIRAEEGKQWVTLSYNKENRISKMEYEGGVLNFEYNSYGKPVLIELEEGGKVSVKYNEDGEIVKVESSDGDHNMALKITQAFQNLLSRVKPAGVSLN